MLTVRPETYEDIESIRYVNEQAFEQKREAEIVAKLRERGVLTTSLVATQDGDIMGHIAFSPLDIEAEGSSFKAICLAPMAVIPMYQRKGIGSKMVQAGLKECRRLGYEIVVVVGYPDYYPRFGFVPANPKVIDCEFDIPDAAWMVIELWEGALASQRGTVRFQPEFKELLEEEA